MKAEMRAEPFKSHRIAASLIAEASSIPMEGQRVCCIHRTWEKGRARGAKGGTVKCAHSLATGSLSLSFSLF